MFGYRFIFIAVLGLLPAPGSLQNAQDVTCNKDVNLKVNPSDCTEALKLVKYQADQTIQYIETHIERGSKGCVVMFDKPLQPPAGGPLPAITQKQFEDGINQILTTCKGVAGTISINSQIKGITFGIRPTKTNPADKVYDDNFPELTVACRKVDPALPDKDCNEAYNSLPTNKQDQFIYTTGVLTNIVSITTRKCQATIFTTDGTRITATKTSLLAAFNQVVNTCKGQAGIIAKSGGVSGMNGRLLIQTSPPPRTTK